MTNPTEQIIEHAVIPLRLLEQYPSFLSEASPEKGVLLNTPLQELRELRALDRFTPERRARLVEAVLPDLERWGAPATALEQARLLLDERACAVVTGQQAGMASGPLYTLYKAVGAVRAARELAGHHPEHLFVPIFWIEADDHDFEEVARLTVLNASGTAVGLHYDDGDRKARHVGDREVSREGLDRLVAELRETLPATDFTDELSALLEDAYGRPGSTLADGFARFLYALLGDTPLVLLSSRNQGMKRLAAELFAAEARNPAPLFEALKEATAGLKESGVPTPIDPAPGALFLTDQGERRSLDPEENGYRLRGTKQRFTFAELEELAQREPERFSPNVVLRPIVQDAVLPTALYLGGPGETAYLRQVRGCYALFGLEPPAVAARPFVLLLEPKAARAWKGGSVQPEQLLAKHFDAGAMVIDAEEEQHIEEEGNRAARGIEEAFQIMEQLAGEIDPTLRKAAAASAARSRKELDNLTGRLRASLKKQRETEVRRLEGARALLAPGGGLQERVISPLYYIGKYGIERFRGVLGSIVTAPGELQIVEL